MFLNYPLSNGGYTLYNNVCYSIYVRLIKTNFGGSPAPCTALNTATEALCIANCPAAVTTGGK